jgi:pilus assembly protein Flp/PilA
MDLECCNTERNIMNIIAKMLRDDSGASAAEYALILAIVGTGIAVAAIGLGSAIKGGLDAGAACINAKTC